MVRETIPDNKLVAIGECIASTESESASDIDGNLIYHESSTSNDSSSYDGELDGAEPPVQKTTKSGRKTGHWSTQYANFVI